MLKYLDPYSITNGANGERNVDRFVMNILGLNPRDPELVIRTQDDMAHDVFHIYISTRSTAGKWRWIPNVIEYGEYPYMRVEEVREKANAMRVRELN